MNVLENFCIYEETYKNNQINDKSTMIFEKIFKTVVWHEQDSVSEHPCSVVIKKSDMQNLPQHIHTSTYLSVHNV
jgi:hypothetical protein